MRAVSTLKSRNNANFIEQKYIDRVLQEEGSNILHAQDRVISRYNVARQVPEIGRRRFTVSNGKAEFTHPIRQRFIDMKYRRGVKQRSIPIHNKIVYGHFNKVVRRMAFGFTDDIKEMIANEHNIHI